ncbi:MAG TPA: methyltransferase domain-containing protein [Actinomycetota bacterium]
MFRRRRPEAAGTTPQRTPSGYHQEDWESYDHVAEAYERVTAERTSGAARDLVELAGVGPGHQVLDVGTGTGVAAIAAIEHVGAEGLVVGLDPSSKMLALARPKHSEVHYVQGEALDLPFRDASFDRVIGNFVVLHFNRWETALFDMVRALRPGGVMGLSSWAASEDAFTEAWRQVAEELIGPELYRDAARRAAPWQERFSNPALFEESLKKAGLRRIRTERRSYRFEMTLGSYLEGMETRTLARSLHRIMGDAIWERFRERVRDEFDDRFAERIGDTRDVWFGLGVRE